jgi:hypothetical protein
VEFNKNRTGSLRNAFLPLPNPRMKTSKQKLEPLFKIVPYIEQIIFRLRNFRNKNHFNLSKIQIPLKIVTCDCHNIFRRCGRHLACCDESITFPLFQEILCQPLLSLLFSFRLIIQQKYDELDGRMIYPSLSCMHSKSATTTTEQKTK